MHSAAENIPRHETSTHLLQTGVNNTKDLHEYCDLTQLAVLKRKSCHPQYADINQRWKSFKTWQHSNLQDPQGLVQAGFYYTGEEDKVRCFMCNGGLCNWDTEDTPWYEHNKWFSGCRYVKECIKHPVVKAIIETATSIQESNSCSENQKNTSEMTNKTAQIEANSSKKQKAKSGNEEESIVGELKRENEELKSMRICKVCMEKTVDVIFLPCGHLVCCVECSLQVKECPVCRGAIKATAKVFL